MADLTPDRLVDAIADRIHDCRSAGIMSKASRETIDRVTAEEVVALDEIERLLVIANNLARCWAPWLRDAADNTMLACALCTGQAESTDMAVTRETGWHDEARPWRMAREAAPHGP